MVEVIKDFFSQMVCKVQVKLNRLYNLMRIWFVVLMNNHN